MPDSHDVRRLGSLRTPLVCGRVCGNKEGWRRDIRRLCEWATVGARAGAGLTAWELVQWVACV